MAFPSLIFLNASFILAQALQVVSSVNFFDEWKRYLKMVISNECPSVRPPCDRTVERKALVKGCFPYQKINQLAYLARELHVIGVSKILDWLEK